MKKLTYDEMRNLYSKNQSIRDIIDAGFNSTMEISNKKTINDKKVRPNTFVVNDDFETNPKCFSAFFYDRIYKVIRCIYVHESFRRQGLAREMISRFQNELERNIVIFLQIGIEYTNDSRFHNLEELYTSMGFKRNKMPIRHPGNKYYYDYFWSFRAFEVSQRQEYVTAHYI